MLNPTVNTDIIPALSPIEKIFEMISSLMPMVIPIINNKKSRQTVCIVFNFPSNFGDNLPLNPIIPPSIRIPKYFKRLVTT